MTMFYGQHMFPSRFSETVVYNPRAADCLFRMGISFENVSGRYGVTRKDQDAFGAESMQKAVKALKAGLFKDEILPKKGKWTDPKTKQEKEILVDHDDGIREGVTPEVLAKLKPSFKPDGTTTAGTASQVSEGAAAVLLARRSVAKKLNLPIIGKFAAAVAVGVPADIMGVGPAFAIPKVLERTGLRIEDIDLFEINEAFASQAVYCVRELKIDPKRVNPQGGAIGIGHPLGCSKCCFLLSFFCGWIGWVNNFYLFSAGARQIVTGLARTKKTGEKIFVTSMCIGSGMGMASVVINEQN